MTDIIRVQDAWYEYERADDEGELAVRGVSLSVRKGEWLSIIGRNGSGKSTLIKLLNGLFLPTRGSVTVGSYDTRDEEHIWDVRQRVGMIFQNPDNQIVATIVEEDVAFGLENLGVNPQEIRERVDAALRAVGMQEYAASAPDPWPWSRRCCSWTSPRPCSTPAAGARSWRRWSGSTARAD